MLVKQVAYLEREKKRRAIPNLNKRFITLSKSLATSKAIPKVRGQTASIIIDSSLETEVVLKAETALVTKV